MHLEGLIRNYSLTYEIFEFKVQEYCLTFAGSASLIFQSLISHELWLRLLQTISFSERVQWELSDAYICKLL